MTFNNPAEIEFWTKSVYEMLHGRNVSGVCDDQRPVRAAEIAGMADQMLLEYRLRQKK